MIDILHCRTGDALTSLANKLSGEEMGIKFNVELINKDIQRLKAELGSRNNKTDDKNLRAIIKYLEKVKSSIKSDGVADICWACDNDKMMYSYPIKFIDDGIYNINTCNYVEIAENEKLLSIGLMDMADIIAFEFMYKDLGEDHESIEDLLDNCSIIGYSSASILTDKFKADGDNMYYLSKSMKIGECDDVCTDGKYICDYFNSKHFSIDGYRDVVEHSCRYAALIIADRLMKNCVKNRIQCKALMITATAIAFIIDSNSAETVMQNGIMEDISIQAFGRKFKITKDIRII